MSECFSESLVNEVWDRGQKVYGYDENLYRKDEFGAWILRKAYGNRSNNMGWEIGGIVSIEDGGGDSSHNLQPLQWQNWDAQQADLLYDR